MGRVVVVLLPEHRERARRSCRRRSGSRGELVMALRELVVAGTSRGNLEGEGLGVEGRRSRTALVAEGREVVACRTACPGKVVEDQAVRVVCPSQVVRRLGCGRSSESVDRTLGEDQLGEGRTWTAAGP